MQHRVTTWQTIDLYHLSAFASGCSCLLCSLMPFDWMALLQTLSACWAALLTACRWYALADLYNLTPCKDTLPMLSISITPPLSTNCTTSKAVARVSLFAVSVVTVLTATLSVTVLVVSIRVTSVTTLWLLQPQRVISHVKAKTMMPTHVTPSLHSNPCLIMPCTVLRLFG